MVRMARDLESPYDTWNNNVERGLGHKNTLAQAPAEPIVEMITSEKVTAGCGRERVETVFKKTIRIEVLRVGVTVFIPIKSR